MTMSLLWFTEPVSCSDVVRALFWGRGRGQGRTAKAWLRQRAAGAEPRPRQAKKLPWGKAPVLGTTSLVLWWNSQKYRLENKIRAVTWLTQSRNHWKRLAQTETWVALWSRNCPHCWRLAISSLMHLGKPSGELHSQPLPVNPLENYIHFES